MNETLKKHWFVAVIAIFMLGFIGYYSIDKIKDSIKVKKVKTKVIDGESVIYSLNGEDYKVGAFFDANKEKLGNQTAFIALQKQVVNEAVEETSQMKEVANQYVAYYNQKTDKAKLLNELRNFGYNDIKQLKNYILFQLKLDVLTSEHLKKHYDEIVKPFLDAEKQPMVLSHILVKVADVKSEKKDGKEVHTLNPSNAEKAKLEKVLTELKTKDFGTVAKENSDDPGSAKVNGSLGYVNAESIKSFVPEFKEAALKLTEDAVSEVIETKYGYHIIKREKINQDTIIETNNFKKAIMNSGKVNQLDVIAEKANELKITFADKELLKKFNADANIKLKGAE